MFTTELLSLVIRVSLLLAAGYLLARILEWKSAAIAHRVLVMTLACTLALPLIAITMPGWQWTQPTWIAFSSIDIENSPARAPYIEQKDVNGLPVRIDEHTVEPDAITSVDPDRSVAESFEATVFGNAVTSESGSQPTLAANAFDSTKKQPIAQLNGVEEVQSSLANASWTWAQLGVAAWFLVTGLLICRLVISLMHLSAFVKNCTLASGEIANQAEAVALQLGLRSRIHVVLSTYDTMPMACWLGRWKIVLPSNFLEWSEASREATLVHELGHIARRDAWSDMLVQGVFCVLWPNPFSWLTMRDVRRLRERACDEWALQKSAIDVKTYAQCLLEVVQRCQTQRLRFASMMAGKKDFESRLRWLMSASRPRAARPAATASILLAIAAMSLAIATAEPTLPQQQTTSSATQNANPGPHDPAKATSPAVELNAVIVSKEPSPASPAISVTGIVTDTDGTPLAEMQVVLRAKIDGSHQYAWAIRHNRDVLARTTTNAEGRFAFIGIGIPPRMIDAIADLRAGKSGAQLVVWGEGKAVTWQPIESFQNAEKQIRLTAEADVSGTVVDAEGNLVDDAELRVTGLTQNTTDLDAFMEDPGDHNLYSSEIVFHTRTMGGRFRIPNMPQDYRVLVGCYSGTGKSAYVVVDTGKGSFDTAKYRNARNEELQVLRTPLTVITQQKPWIRIRVMDHNGNQVSGGGIEAIDLNRHYGGNAQVGSDGTAVLIVNTPGVHEIHYASDPLTPAVGLRQTVDIQVVESPVVEVKLLPSKMLTGKVVDSETGAPIAGAYVEGGSITDADRTMPHAMSAMTVTGTDGVFRLPVVAGQCVLSLRHDIDGYFAKTHHSGRGPAVPSGSINVTVSNDSVPDNVVIKIGNGMVIHGTITDIEGRPVANAQVQAENDEEPYRRATTVTDKDGKYRFTGFSPYVAAYISTWTEAGTASGGLQQNLKHPWNETLTRTLDLKLSPGTTVTGRVLQNSQPVPGVKVKLNSSPPRPSGQDWIRYRLQSETITDNAGRYRLPGLFKGAEFNLEVDAPGKGEVRDWQYQSPYGHTNNREDGATIEVPDAILVTNGQELSGIVVDPDGKPVSRITVSARLASGGMLSRPKNGAPPWTESDDKGRFHLTNLPEEPISLIAYRANPAGGPIHYASNLTVELNATDIRIVLDPKLGSDVEDLDAK